MTANYADLSAGEIARALDARVAELKRLAGNGALPPAPELRPAAPPIERDEPDGVRAARQALAEAEAEARRRAAIDEGRAPAPSAESLQGADLQRALQEFALIEAALMRLRAILARAPAGFASLGGIQLLAPSSQSPPAGFLGDPRGHSDTPKPKPEAKPWQKIGVSLTTYKRLKRAGMLKE